MIERKTIEELCRISKKYWLGNGDVDILPKMHEVSDKIDEKFYWEIEGLARIIVKKRLPAETLSDVLRVLGYEVKDESTIWNDCSKRLPETRGHYLVSVDKGDGWRKVEIGLFENGEWFYYNNGSVMAWAELPEPYQGGDE